MEANQRDFIELLVQSGVLQFGDFVGKSGRHMPYFFDAGRYRKGAQVARLGRCYADAIHARLGTGFDLLFGPAYKGIPLVVTTAIALHERHGRDLGFCFDRKEAKDHGEGGRLIGTQPEDGARVLIVEDVVTAGTAVRHSIELLRATAAVQIVGLVVGVDRMERGRGDKSALRELADEFGIDAFAIATIDDVVAELRNREIDGRRVIGPDEIERIAAYRAQYGAR